MAKAKTAETKPGPIQRLRTFLSDVKAELDKVTWPSKDDLKMSTKVTMYMLGIMAAVIFGFDKFFEIAVFTLLQMTTT